MRVLIDGVEFPVKDDVKIIFDIDKDEFAVPEEAPSEMHMTFSEEGIVADLLGEANLPLGTFSMETSEMVSEMPFH